MRCPRCQSEGVAGARRCPRDGAALYEAVDEVLSRGPVGLAQAVRWALALGDLLVLRRRQGRAPAPLGPANVYLSPPLEEPSVFLWEEAPVPTSHRPPETLAGEPPAPAAEVYGLGLLLHQLMSGRAAFRGASEAQTERLVREAPPGPLDVRRVEDVPAELEGLVQLMLAKEPGRRPPTVQVALERIENMDLDSTILGARLMRAARQAQEEAALDAPTLEAGAAALPVRVARPRGPAPAQLPEVRVSAPLQAPGVGTQLMVDPFGDTFIRPRAELEEDGAGETMIRPPVDPPLEAGPREERAGPRDRIPPPAVVSPSRPGALGRASPRAEPVTEAAPPARAGVPVGWVVALGVLAGAAVALALLLR